MKQLLSLAAGVFASAFLPFAAAQASTPADLADLVGARGRDGEVQLHARGYYLNHVSRSGSSVMSYWWNSAKRACVRVTTENGRYHKVKTAPLSDCNQFSRHDKNDKAAAVAAGAAAILGLAVLAHKSHHRDELDYNVDQTAAFERGFRDGLYNMPFHNYGNSSEYSFGYTRGVEERRHQTSYRTDSGSRGGSHAHVNVSDLNEQETTYTWGQLERRGFKLANERKLGGGQFQWLYWNSKTVQCVEVVSEGNWVNYVGEASAAACRK